MKKVLVLGGYGNFGKRIARLLTNQNIFVIIAGRNRVKAKALSDELPKDLSSISTLDITSGFLEKLKIIKPAVVINTCGPFQNSDYSVAKACIEFGVHYIDLADSRDFVREITTLDTAAKAKNITVISGASTVPCLSSAIVEHYLPEFSEIDSLKFGISPGQKTERGLATTKGVLIYLGKRLKSCSGYEKRYGWQDLYLQKYPEIGNRWMANCEVPDLDLLPEKYGIKKIRFSAGMENPMLHLSIWALSWIVRSGFPIKLEDHASLLLKASDCFNFLGSADSGMHLILEGKNHNGENLVKKWFIVAFEGDGPYIPTIPSVILTKKLLEGKFNLNGAMPCVALISLKEYLEELKNFNIKTFEN